MIRNKFLKEHRPEILKVQTECQISPSVTKTPVQHTPILLQIRSRDTCLNVNDRQTQTIDRLLLEVKYHPLLHLNKSKNRNQRVEYLTKPRKLSFE